MKQKMKKGDPEKETKFKALTDDQTLKDLVTKSNQIVKQKERVWIGCFPNCCVNGHWEEV